MFVLNKEEATAVAWFAVHVINTMFDFEFKEGPEDPLDYCCVECCGPCAQLYRFYKNDNDRETLEGLISLTGYNKDGWAFWNAEEDCLRWDLLMENWKRHQGCSMSDGIVSPCGLYYKGEE